MHAASVEIGIPGLNPVPIDQTAWSVGAARICQVIHE